MLQPSWCVPHQPYANDASTLDAAPPRGEALLHRVQVDDLLEGRSVRLFGQTASSAVAIEHVGYALYPLADEEGADHAQGLQTSAAFVPLHMLGGDSSGSSDEE